MGYYANSYESNFLLLRENSAKLLDAAHQKWHDPKDRVEDIDDLFHEFGFTVYENENGDIDGLYFEADKYRCDEVKLLFKLIAPFVQAGSYITFGGEDGSWWAFYFDGQSVKEYEGQIIYPGMPMDGPKAPGSIAGNKQGLYYH